MGGKKACPAIRGLCWRCSPRQEPRIKLLSVLIKKAKVVFVGRVFRTVRSWCSVDLECSQRVLDINE